MDASVHAGQGDQGDGARDDVRGVDYVLVDDADDLASRVTESVLRLIEALADRDMHFALTRDPLGERVRERLSTTPDLPWPRITVWATDGDVDEHAAESHPGSTSFRALAPGAQLPAFDLVLLEAREDGSVAGLFDAAATTEGDLDVLRTVDPAGRERLTISMRAIRAARHVWTIAAGDALRTPVTEAFAAALDGRGDTPLVGARPANGRAVWWLDAAAGASLRKHRRD